MSLNAESNVRKIMFEASGMISASAPGSKTLKMLADDAETNTSTGAGRTKTRKSNLSPRVFPTHHLPLRHQANVHKGALDGRSMSTIRVDARSGTVQDRVGHVWPRRTWTVGT